jgi:hypothetical protein
VLIEVLDILRRYFEANLTEAIEMLGEVQAEARGETGRGRRKKQH